MVKRIAYRRSNRFIICISILLIYGAIVFYRAFEILGMVNVEVNETNSLNSQLFPYHLRFVYSKDSDAVFKDENGIYYLDHGKLQNLGSNNGIEYSPTTIGFYALKDYQIFVDHMDSLAYRSFLKNAEWLVNNQTIEGNWHFTINRFRNDKELKAPWISCLSQGVCISVLSRAFLLSHDSSFYHGAKLGIAPFRKEVGNGGLKTCNDFGIYFEEYPFEKSDHVLNGYIYGLLGLYDAGEILAIKDAKYLFDLGAHSLNKTINNYDLGYWSLYDRSEVRNMKNHYGIASPWYQKLHASQLKVMYNLTMQEIFLEYSIRFENQRKGIFAYFISSVYVIYTDFVRIKRKLS